MIYNHVNVRLTHVSHVCLLGFDKCYLHWSHRQAPALFWRSQLLRRGILVQISLFDSLAGIISGDSSELKALTWLANSKVQSSLLSRGDSAPSRSIVEWDFLCKCGRWLQGTDGGGAVSWRTDLGPNITLRLFKIHPLSPTKPPNLLKLVKILQMGAHKLMLQIVNNKLHLICS